MRLWLIPMIYVGASAVCGLSLPPIKQVYLGSPTLNLSVASAQAYLSAAASGMMVLTGIVFAMAFVMVLEHLDLVIEHSTLDAKDRLMAHQEDRQGLGLTRGPAATD
jgi:hypothetical protein